MATYLSWCITPQTNQELHKVVSRWLSYGFLTHRLQLIVHQKILQSISVCLYILSLSVPAFLQSRVKQL